MSDVILIILGHSLQELFVDCVTAPRDKLWEFIGFTSAETQFYFAPLHLSPHCAHRGVTPPFPPTLITPPSAEHYHTCGELELNSRLVVGGYKC